MPSASCYDNTALTFFLALGMEKRRGRGGGRSDALGLEGQQGSLEICAGRMSTASTVVGADQAVREPPRTPGLGSCLGRTRLEEWMSRLNQIPFRDNQTFPPM